MPVARMGRRGAECAVHHGTRKEYIMRFRNTRRDRAVAILFSALLAATAAFAAEPGNSYQRRDLVSDGGVPAEHQDPDLVNGWGMAASAAWPWRRNAAVS